MGSVQLICIRGNSGSGKTTLAKSLQGKIPGSLLICQDTIRREICNEKDGPDIFACDIILNLLEFARVHERIVILEGIFPSRYYASLFECIIRMYPDSILAFYYDLPFEVTLLRHRTRLLSEEIDEDTFHSWYREHDFMPGLQETVLDESCLLQQAQNDILAALRRKKL